MKKCACVGDYCEYSNKPVSLEIRKFDKFSYKLQNELWT